MSKSNCFRPSYYTKNRGRKLPTSIRKAKKQYKKTYCRMLFPKKRIKTLFKVLIQPQRCSKEILFKVYFRIG